MLNNAKILSIAIVTFLSTYNTKFFSYSDAPESWQIGIQDPATPNMEGMINFHNYIMIFLISIGIFVLWMLYKVITDFDEEVNPVPEKFTHSSALEIIWFIGLTLAFC